ncbi:MAG: radical SAM family heme chaperone HemW [Alphaproteobacteria bacterium]|nr:radical SAM family heme chaperone HemW [Alphaproteobacteria bacterium]MCB9794802.1 radical SAM family heme chaperone HemW [Alphaproteobacteria bacterium]
MEYDYWREYPDHDPQAMVWYPLNFGPLSANRVWPVGGAHARAQTSWYVHVPFCAVVCPFCPFNKYASVQSRMRRFVDNARRELDMVAERGDWASKTLRAGFFGGGTPTALPTPLLVELVQHTKEVLPWTAQTEITVEGSPETLSEEKLAALQELGVNRVSFGVQSFDDATLRRLGRGHDAAAALRSVQVVRDAGFDNLAIDLMYRLPGQTLQEWEWELERALETGVEHISAYSMFIEPGSPLEKVRRRGKILSQASEQVDMAMFRALMDRLGDAGYELYTLYDFAKPERRSDHHLVNWAAPQAEYVPIGPGAFGYVNAPHGEFVYGNHNPLEDYFTSLEAGELPIQFGIELSLEERMCRYMVLGANAQPIPRAPFREMFGCDMVDIFGPTIEQLTEWGLVTLDADALHLTTEGKVYQANVGKAFTSSRNKHLPHPAGVDLQRGSGLSMIGIGLQSE